MDKCEYIWLNGKLVKWADAKVHVLAHGLNYGTAVFEGIRVYETPKGKAIFRLKDHVRRMLNGCKVLAFDMTIDGKEYGFDEIMQAIKDAVNANKKVDYLKPCMFLSGEETGLNPIGVPTSFSVTPVYMGNYLGVETDKGATLITSSWHRPDNLCAPAGAKVNGTYVTSCLAKREAKMRGADEAVMLNANGYVAECTGENIFLCKNGKIYTPSSSNSILEGITRNSIIQIAKDMGYEVIETNISRVELLTADEVWMTGTAAELAPVTTIDERPVGNGKIGPITIALKNRFHEVVAGKVPEYNDWIDLV